MRKMNIDNLFEKESRIPSLPQVFYQFKEAVEDTDTSFEKLAGIIECDLGLTARLLKIVNSPFYGFPSQVETIPHAISIIGNNQLNDLVLSTCIIDHFKNIPQKSMDMQLFWEHSIACGLTAKIIAKHFRSADPESIFVGGLVHDIGRLVICINAPQKFTEIFLKTESEGKSLLEAEKIILGFGHDEVGGELLRRWKLPKVHEESVRFHHDPSKALLFPKEAAIIKIANSIVKLLTLGCSGDLLAPEIEKEPKAILGIKDEEVFTKIKQEVQEQYQSTNQIFLENA